MPALLKDLVGSDARQHFSPRLLQESNDWTVSGALTRSGKPLLANDPHRVLAEPSLRYIVHLVAPGWNVIGAGEPGLPGVAAGHNERIGWGFTIFDIDQQDLYLETLNPADPLKYKTSAGWQPMTVVHETIAVRGAPAVEVDLKFTQHGPVLWEQGTRALALRWVGAEPGTAGYLGSLTLDRARNWQEFEAAMPRWKVPAENIVYADRDGNIGEHSTALAPLREKWTGLLPVSGQGGFEWSGFVPNAELPHSYNPTEKFVATANNKMIPDGYPYAVGFEWPEPTRFLRIKEVLQRAKDNNHKLEVSDMEKLQTDIVSNPARELQSLLRGAIERRGPPGNEALRAIAESLLRWDCALRTDSTDAAVYEFWAGEMSHSVTDRAVSGAARVALGEFSPGRVIRELSNPQTSLFGADPEAARDALLFSTLESARTKLVARAGPDTHAWTWGRLHQLKFQHVLDSIPTTAALFDRGPLPQPGDGDTVRASYFADDSFAPLDGASYREIFDLDDWDKSVGINVPGQSGQPGSKHYDDLLPLWMADQYFPLAYTRRAVDAVTTDVLQLTPGR